MMFNISRDGATELLANRPEQSAKNCRFTAFHRQLAPLALDHIETRDFF